MFVQKGRHLTGAEAETMQETIVQHSRTGELSLRDIAEATGRSHETVRQVLIRAGVHHTHELNTKPRRKLRPLMDLEKTTRLSNAVLRELRLQREKQHVSQAAVARYLGLTKSMLTRIETGSRSLDISRLIGLCLLLDLSPAQVFARAQRDTFPRGWEVSASATEEDVMWPQQPVTITPDAMSVLAGFCGVSAHDLLDVLHDFPAPDSPSTKPGSR